MPCRDWDWDERSALTAAQINEKNLSVLKQLTPLLCEACMLLEVAGMLESASPELLAWYKAHEKCEEDRVRYEAALKLNERELRLLGINLADLKLKAGIK